LCPQYHFCTVIDKGDFKNLKNLTNQKSTIMKKLFYTLAFTVLTALAISGCTEETIQPADGVGSNDPCQFGGAGCPKGN
jgi:hypothetical protein